jgi:hypothetical protein
MLNEGNQIHNFISSSGSDLLTSSGCGSGYGFLRFRFHNAVIFPDENVPPSMTPASERWEEEGIFTQANALCPA